MVNDVTALTGDAEMANIVAESGAGVVIMHMQGTPRTMQDSPHYDNVVREVRDHLAARVAALVARGIDPACIAIDPGIGFGKALEHNLALLANLEACRVGDRPMVVGASRKRFLGALTGREVNDRLAGSLAVSAYVALNGADVIRVHDVRESLDDVRVIAALRKECYASVD